MGGRSGGLVDVQNNEAEAAREGADLPPLRCGNRKDVLTAPVRGQALARSWSAYRDLAMKKPATREGAGGAGLYPLVDLEARARKADAEDRFGRAVGSAL
jgi:hypothetical protein